VESLRSELEALNVRQKVLQDTEAVIAKQLNALNEMLTSNVSSVFL
jgi:chaperonin cofactor prefoldin